MAKQRQPRSVISKVMKQVLVPLGFIRAKGLFVRARHDQVHGIGVQTSHGQLEYTINIAFHYSFLRSLRFKYIPLEEYYEMDCVFRSRLGFFLSEPDERGHDEWWSCMPADAEFEVLLKQRLFRSVELLDEYSTKWSEPGCFLRLVPPAVLAEEVPIDGVAPGTPSGDSVPKVWKLLPKWCPDVFELSYCLCEIALREGQFAAAVEYADVGLAQELSKWCEPRKNVLRNLREAARRRGRRPGNGKGDKSEWHQIKPKC